MKSETPRRLLTSRRRGRLTLVAAALLAAVLAVLSLFAHLDAHIPHIAVANATAGDQPCCGAETYFLTGQRAGEGAARLAAFFPHRRGASSPSRVAAEKTPGNSHAAIAPYRARALFAPGALALLFTFRDPVDAHVSLYMHERGPTPCVPSFLEWSASALAAFDAYAACAADAAAQEGFPGAAETNLTLRHRPPWLGRQVVEEAVQWRCAAPHPEVAATLGYAYTHSLGRWRRVLPSVPLLCLEHEALAAAPAAEVARLLRWLRMPAPAGAPRDGSRLLGDAAAQRREPAVARLMRLASNSSEAAAARAQLAAVQAAFEGQLEYARRVCAGALPTPAAVGWGDHRR